MLFVTSKTVRWTLNTHTPFYDYIISILRFFALPCLISLYCFFFFIPKFKTKKSKIIKLILFWTHAIYFEQQQQKRDLKGVS